MKTIEYIVFVIKLIAYCALMYGLYIDFEPIIFGSIGFLLGIILIQEAHLIAEQADG